LLDVPAFTRDAETFSRALGRQRYLYGAGLQPTLDLSALYDDFAHLFRADTFGELLEADVEPTCKRMLLDFLTTGHLADRARSYTERLAADRSAMTVPWDEQALPYVAVPAFLAGEPDAHRRHDLAGRYQAATATLNPLYEERHRAWLEGAPGLDDRGYVSLYDDLRGLHLADLAEASQRVLTSTEAIYLDALEDMLGTIGLARADATDADLGWLFRSPRFDTQYPAKGLLATLYRWLRDLGIDLQDQTNIAIDLEARPLKSPRACCVCIGVPDDVRLALRPIGGRLDYAALFHQAGVAEQAAHTDRTLTFPYRRLGDGSVAASYGFLVERLLAEPAWLERYLAIDYPIDHVRVAQLQYLYVLRRCASYLLYEQILHREDNYDALAEAYAELFTRTLGVEHAREGFLTEVGLGLASATAVRACIFESQHRRYLQREFDEEWFRSPRAGRFLREIWRDGRRYTVEELARFMGYDGLDLRPLLDELLVNVG
jgi:hypothetical protein